ncbi:hypothetical protein DPMN_158507 [Dreissena polymorpha]|uniref:Uncharacterized protein n=1 Tax=Dreissena polymorpha TaxID=45954 RepID=A0A9D4EJY1_DREPO|nr:hypothetical protein DPMN_158507 [Dreissena polymorpha]
MYIVVKRRFLPLSPVQARMAIKANNNDANQNRDNESVDLLKQTGIFINEDLTKIHAEVLTSLRLKGPEFVEGPGIDTENYSYSLE